MAATWRRSQDEAFEAVITLDSFPYVVMAGEETAARLIREAARVLSPGGTLAILNYSYRGDPERDAAEAAELGQAAGLRLTGRGTQPFEQWDGRVYLMQKPPVS